MTTKRDTKLKRRKKTRRGLNNNTARSCTTTKLDVSFTDAAGDEQCEHFELNVEASHSDQVCCRDLLRVFPSTPSPPYMKSV